MALKLTTRDFMEGMRNVAILGQVVERHQHAKIQVGGKSVAVDAQTANALTTVYNALNPDNQAKFAGMLAHNAGTFKRMVDFSWAYTKGG